MPHQIVVVADDEPDLLDMLCEALELEGIEVVYLDHPAKVALSFQQRLPSLFLLDLMLPDTNGIELAQQLRSSGFSRTPILALSASPQMVTLAQRSGIFQETVTKPFDLDALLSTIEEHLPDDSEG